MGNSWSGRSTLDHRIIVDHIEWMEGTDHKFQATQGGAGCQERWVAWKDRQGELGWQRGPEGRRLWVDPSSSWVCVDVLMDRSRVGRTGTLRGEFRENPSNQAVLPLLACISDIVIG